MAITGDVCVIVRVEHTNIRHEAAPGTSGAESMRRESGDVRTHPGTIHRELDIMRTYQY